MPRAVRYDEFGGIDVLRVDEVERPTPGDGQVLVRVKAAGINPSEAVIRTGAVSKLFPSTFPSGQGSDLAGAIAEGGPRGGSGGRGVGGGGGGVGVRAVAPPGGAGGAGAPPPGGVRGGVGPRVGSEVGGFS